MSLVCSACHVGKNLDSFRRDKEGNFYANCSDCFLAKWRQDQLDFWKDKCNKRCADCNETVPVANFTKDRRGLYFKSCRACFSAKYKAERAKENAIAGSANDTAHNRTATSTKKSNIRKC
jgi:hypothetical protein